jgi:hypothetical protein
MNESICAACFSSLAEKSPACFDCGGKMVWEGEKKSVIDRLEPNCLIHRFDGSDMLEAAYLLKEAKTNFKVATKLKEYKNPLSVSKTNVFKFDDKIFSAIQALRNERSAVMHRYDLLIKSHWDKLKSYGD